MTTINKTLLILLIWALTIAPAGCKKSDDGEGSAERAGKKIDNALEKAGQETGKLMERVGESMQKAAENMQDKSKQ
jgi:hyperosmotically inducible protein